VKVAFVHNLKAGGAHRTMSEHMRHLGFETAEFCLQTAVPVSPAARITPLAPLAPRVPAPARPPLRYLDMVALMTAWRRLARAVERSGAEVIVAHPCQFLQCPPALLHTEIRSVYFCHETRRVDYEPTAGGQRSRLTRPVYAALYAWERRTDRAAVARAGTLVTNSDFTAGRILAAYGRTAEVLPLGVAGIFTPDERPRPAAHVLGVGALIPSKGHDLVLAAVARSAVRLPVILVAPQSAPDEEARLRALAGRLGVALEIRVGISDQALRDLYRAALATLYLAREEPLGLVSLEAQACGCPVIVAAAGGLPETLLEGETGWAVPRDAAQAARRLDLLSAPGARERIGTAASRHASAFTWEASTRELQRVLAPYARRPCSPGGVS
jgi:glycosyltransferase involved in cell wall biosynthesis